jgi:hypothetical protein
LSETSNFNFATFFFPSVRETQTSRPINQFVVLLTHSTGQFAQGKMGQRLGRYAAPSHGSSYEGKQKTPKYVVPPLPEKKITEVSHGARIRSYKLRGLIGEGSFGKVFKASQGEEIFALKVCKSLLFFSLGVFHLSCALLILWLVRFMYA